MLSISKWIRRWENSKYTIYKDIVPSISHKKLTLRATPLKNTSRRGISKIARLKTGHSMLKGHESKFDTESPVHFLLNCKEYDTESVIFHPKMLS